MKVVASFVESRSSLIVEGVHLSVNVLMKVVSSFPNVVPFLIYIKKEDFHRQRFAVRAKYMTTDPGQNKYISNFDAIRSVQSSLSKGASEHLIPKIDNRNIDRSIETMHQTLFSYLKKLEGRQSMFDPKTEKLTFLDMIWKRRKQKMTSKAKTLKAISMLTTGGSADLVTGEEQTLSHSLQDLLESLPSPDKVFRDSQGGNDISFNSYGTMLLGNVDIQEDDGMDLTTPPVPVPPHNRVSPFFIEQKINDDSNEEQEATETEADPVELTLTDFAETTDTETGEALIMSNGRFVVRN
ncbi:hypothetical protein TVAG_065360 [Trichomonas vaginalis G3]|uniref:Uncharacterized protein n=1 Tax=Trichomonas vaginalis (strain ATCC PRA-98 / G3) TaxID=412133 RepID=A2FUW9_TRIV3|nr:myo-inositol hexakisphosphate metabolic process [Trichomonas vaginalis G3]EAX91320.1 hypothetical protein TVAG_065360 [Trichomonas vaginalis G3]KAI5492993.1 myo-inositol hexakisphosphate metabolic process [Trichomonas vaginalis G3]|eukprot:XP_001304250.1 hypothetical protein [Trichomonas vaginalis G3]